MLTMIPLADDQPAESTETSPGESLAVPERLLVAPIPGRFEPSCLPDGRVRPGQTVGVVVRSDDRVEVVSDVDGHFMGHLVDHGQRVRDGQPIAWIRLAG
jgi:biotin carboxyl carrier protein